MSLENSETPLNYKGGTLHKSPFILSLDWVQINCKLKLDSVVNDKGEIVYDIESYLESLPSVFDNGYSLLDTGNRTLHYKKLFNFVYHDKAAGDIILADIQMNPHVSFIPKTSCIVKISNRILYCENYEQIIKSILDTVALQFVNYSRLDIAYDFNCMFGFDSPSKFIGSLADTTFVVAGQKSFRLFKNDSGVEQAGTDISYESEQFFRKREYNAFKLGSRKSPVTVSMYNKTIELQKKKDKPWIRECWHANGLVGDVWRLEFSLKNDGKDLVNLLDGDIKSFYDFDFIKFDNLQNVYTYCLDRHLKVAEFEQGKKFHRMKRIKLFDNYAFAAFDFMRLSFKGQSDSMVKNRLKNYYYQLDRYRQNEYMIHKANAIASVIIDTCKHYSLETWFVENVSSLDTLFTLEPEIFLDSLSYD